MTEAATREPLLDEEFLGKLERLSLVSRSTIIGRIRGERRSRRRGFSNEFADFRDYVPGDDLRYLDWNIFGRLERLFIKDESINPTNSFKARGLSAAITRAKALGATTVAAMQPTLGYPVRGSMMWW